jgi:hypothetical protein
LSVCYDFFTHPYKKTLSYLSSYNNIPLSEDILLLNSIEEYKKELESYKLELSKIEKGKIYSKIYGFFLNKKYKNNKDRIEYLKLNIHNYKITILKKEIEYDSKYGDIYIKEAYREIGEIIKPDFFYNL